VKAFAPCDGAEKYDLARTIIHKSHHCLQHLDLERCHAGADVMETFISFFSEPLPSLVTLVLPKVGFKDGRLDRELVTQLLSSISAACPNLRELRTGKGLHGLKGEFDLAPFKNLKIFEIFREFRFNVFPESSQHALNQLDLLMIDYNDYELLQDALKERNGEVNENEDDGDYQEYMAWWWTRHDWTRMARETLGTVPGEEDQFLKKVMVRKDDFVTPMQQYLAPVAQRCFPMGKEDFDEIRKDPKHNSNLRRCIAYSIPGGPTTLAHVFFAVAGDSGLNDGPEDHPERILPGDLIQAVPLYHILHERHKIAFPKSYICPLMCKTLQAFSPEFCLSDDAVAITCNAILARGIIWDWHSSRPMSDYLSRIFDDQTTSWWSEYPYQPLPPPSSFMTAQDCGVNLLMLFCSHTIADEKSHSVPLWLIQNRSRLGIDVNAKDVFGNTALDFAVDTGKIFANSVLLEALRVAGAVCSTQK
jgi:hypothetical protein